MKLYRFEDVAAFHDHTQPYLLQHEAQHLFLLNFIEGLLNFSDCNTTPYLATVAEQGETIAIAFCPFSQLPHYLILSVVSQFSAVPLIVDDLYAVTRTLTGVSGLATGTQAFVAAWRTRSGQVYELKRQLRFYQLDAVRPVSGVRGQLRLAEECDRALLMEWFEAFAQTVVVDGSESTEQRVTSQLEAKSLYIWQDQLPVALVGTKRTGSGNGQIGSVYTPPEYRRNGYATAAVAAVSQILLDQGCSACYLSTNLNNATSNHVYAKVGYQPVGDWHRYEFESSSS